MSNDLERLRKLAGMTSPESEVLSTDDTNEMNDRLYDEADARETKVIMMVGQMFDRIGLEVETEFGATGRDKYSGIHYYESEDGDVYVTLDDIEAPLSKLVMLRKTGLSADFKVGCSGGKLQITFVLPVEIRSGAKLAP